MMTLDFATTLGICCVVIAVLCIAYSRYRYWLVFMFAGMIFWAGLELIRFLIQSLIDMPLLYGYISAFVFSLLGFTIALIIKDYRHKSKISKVNCIEHTPVYDDDRQCTE